ELLSFRDDPAGAVPPRHGVIDRMEQRRRHVVAAEGHRHAIVEEIAERHDPLGSLGAEPVEMPAALVPDMPVGVRREDEAEFLGETDSVARELADMNPNPALSVDGHVAMHLMVKIDDLAPDGRDANAVARRFEQDLAKRVPGQRGVITKAGPAGLRERGGARLVPRVAALLG